MIKGTWVQMPDGSRVAAIHLGEGKLQGVDYSYPDPTPEDRKRRVAVTAREAQAKLAALGMNCTVGEKPKKDAKADPIKEEEKP